MGFAPSITKAAAQAGVTPDEYVANTVAHNGKFVPGWSAYTPAPPPPSGGYFVVGTPTPVQGQLNLQHNVSTGSNLPLNVGDPGAWNQGAVAQQQQFQNVVSGSQLYSNAVPSYPWNGPAALNIGPSVPLPAGFFSAAGATPLPLIGNLNNTLADWAKAQQQADAAAKTPIGEITPQPPPKPSQAPFAPPQAPQEPIPPAERAGIFINNTPSVTDRTERVAPSRNRLDVYLAPDSRPPKPKALTSKQVAVSIPQAGVGSGLTITRS